MDVMFPKLVFRYKRDLRRVYRFYASIGAKSRVKASGAKRFSFSCSRPTKRELTSFRWTNGHLAVGKSGGRRD
jgi:hypothetical protein